MTRAELEREASRLPASLREQFDSPAGERDLAQSIVDRRLMVDEARRRGLDRDEELRRQVQALEDRLLIQALLAAEEKQQGPAPEATLRAWFEANKESFRLPERVRLARVFARAPAQAPAAERAKAKARAQAWLAKLQRGDAIANLQSQSDGAERASGGELGLFAQGDLADKALERAAFALSRPGQLSPVVELADGYAVLQLIERKPGRSPAFEEVRTEVQSRYLPVRQRELFDELRLALRKGANVTIELGSRR